MKQLYHSGSADSAACKEAAKVRALINELGRRVRILESDIAREEERAGVSNAINAAYPVLARAMAAQRDNLKQTIAALEQRLPSEPVVLAG
jgi:phage shock protein A